MKKLLLTFNLYLTCMMVFAQSGTLAKKVTGTNGETIAFASAAVKGTSMGTPSDERGYANSTSFLATKTSSALQDVSQSLGYVTMEPALEQAAFRLNDVVKNISGVNRFSFYNDITIRGHRISGQRDFGMLVNGMWAFTTRQTNFRSRSM